jgi:hypothetical protein
MPQLVASRESMTERIKLAEARVIFDNSNRGDMALSFDVNRLRW